MKTQPDTAPLTPLDRGSSRPFVLTRTFDATRERVWKAWTDGEQLRQWFGPKGFTMGTCTLDLRPGGLFHYSLRTPDGREMWGKWTFREVVPPEKLVVVVSFSDAKGGVTRHPMNSNWPAETLSTTTFTEHDGKTTLSISLVPLNATAAEQALFDQSHDGMNLGWKGTMEQLTAFLAKR
jgi:uncharacterized protein YndB with AHSA1/START domain